MSQVAGSGAIREQRWSFHQLQPRQFEELAATVLEEKFGIHLLTFSEGRDGGRDAVARAASIRLGRGKTLESQDIVVQAKHTKKTNCLLDDSLRNLLFKPELKKARQLVKANELDIYIAVTNYRITAGQEKKIVTSFKEVGCRTVIVVGRESLKRWIKQSEELMKNIANMYNIGGPGIREIATRNSQDIQGIRKDMDGIRTQLVEAHSQTDEQLQRMSRQQTISIEELQNTSELIRDVKATVSSEHKVAPPLKRLSSGVQWSNDRLKELSYVMHSKQEALNSLRQKIEYNGVGSLNRMNSTRQAMATRRRPIKTTDVEVADSSLLKLTRHCGVLREWRFLARFLGLEETDIMEVATSGGSLREQAYQALLLWRQRSGDGGTRCVLGQALMACKLQAAAGDLEADISGGKAEQSGSS